ncbi:hypothetical protein [Flavobacterium aestivum]|uniref:hypothetical protein n=1 Tax=Flavobacterium aestivum TaxID=3003257 RepID=UPI002285ED4F|nr:hypothetical protein [Flavobacterium aestivum]
MSLVINILKIVSIVTFLLIPGLDENTVPNFAFIALCLFQSFHDIFNNSIHIFWEGLILIPILTALVIFYKSKNYKILFICFLILLLPLTYATGLIKNYARIDFWFVFTYGTFIITSIAVILLAQKKDNSEKIVQ